KNTVAVASGTQVFISQHIGDLDTYEAIDALPRTARDLCDLYQIQPSAVACDLHPDYASTQYAESLGLPLMRVQHHEAHILACLAEHGLDERPALGVSWDGTGYGPDSTVWGGEFLRVTPDGCQRVGHLRTFPLPGGDAVAREPRRSASGLLYALYGEAVFERDDLAPLAAFSTGERAVLRQMLQRGLNAPQTSSAGRLFDAVAALLDLRQRAAFEGQAAMALEFAADCVATDEVYPFSANREYTGSDAAPVLVIDWGPLVEALLADKARGVPPEVMAAIFHNTLAALIVDVARQVGEPIVALSGGCFQNRRLLAQTIKWLRAAGLRPLWPRLVPPNDGGIALGQIVAAARETERVTGGKS
ncbi:MAG: carbamoyltransferase HypF, partial [Phototrophicaceae bacterium]